MLVLKTLSNTEVAFFSEIFFFCKLQNYDWWVVWYLVCYLWNNQCNSCKLQFLNHEWVHNNYKDRSLWKYCQQDEKMILILISIITTCLVIHQSLLNLFCFDEHACMVLVLFNFVHCKKKFLTMSSYWVFDYT